MSRRLKESTSVWASERGRSFRNEWLFVGVGGRVEKQTKRCAAFFHVAKNGLVVGIEVPHIRKLVREVVSNEAK